MIESIVQGLETIVRLAPLATLAAIYVIYRVLLTVRKNDLAHIDEKLDGHHKTVTERIDRLEQRLDQLFTYRGDQK